jgi:hypothetical protein
VRRAPVSGNFPSIREFSRQGLKFKGMNRNRGKKFGNQAQEHRQNGTAQGDSVSGYYEFILLIKDLSLKTCCMNFQSSRKIFYFHFNWLHKYSE